MHIHIIGICGTFMGGLALLAKQLGYQVSGSDQGIYPPMSTQLAASGIQLCEGFQADNLAASIDLVIVGNAISRGNPELEAVLNQSLPYTSGPQWLAEHVLQGRHVLAVAGTHGKTTTSSMLAWILEFNGKNPGFLIGGVPQDFAISARLGDSPFFVVEADEYDSAFFDKRSKFVHYKPKTLIINNLEFDHADIFDDLAAIQKQFHHLIRTIPQLGLIISPHQEPSIEQTLAMGCWTPVETTALTHVTQTEQQAPDWSAQELNAQHFEVFHQQQSQGIVQWNLSGAHNRQNGLAAIAAAKHVGIETKQAIAALNQFKGVKRRLEQLAQYKGITIYDDFAHHPTAIQLTLEGLRKQLGDTANIIAIIEPRSNTMRMGVHAEHLINAVSCSDQAWIYQAPNLDWSLDQLIKNQANIRAFSDGEALIKTLMSDHSDNTKTEQHWVFMSNGAFAGIYQQAIAAIQAA